VDEAPDFLPYDVHKRLTHIHWRTADNPYAMIGLMQTIHAKRPTTIPVIGRRALSDYRVPERRYVADRWVATCVGNKAEVERLLSMVQYFGKASKRGCGFIDSWTVEAIDRFSWRDADGFALRPIPTDDDSVVGVRQGFTPPYWLRETWVVCEPSIAGQTLS
jgi:CRISPR type IV-associated protein Csf3